MTIAPPIKVRACIQFLLKNYGSSESQRITLSSRPIWGFLSKYERPSYDFSIFLPSALLEFSLSKKKCVTWQKMPCSLDRTREWTVRASFSAEPLRYAGEIVDSHPDLLQGDPKTLSSHTYIDSHSLPPRRTPSLCRRLICSLFKSYLYQVAIHHSLKVRKLNALR